MNYQETLDFLFQALPMYQRVGKTAFKKDLTNTLALCEGLGNPQHKFKSIHIAGTNGKGSSSHMLAAVLQAAGYKVGLYTSPHLKNFTERIRIDGEEISKNSVVTFVDKQKVAIESIKPSFFEMTVAMAFDHFANEQVDVAVIEVGLGGRLDSTNVITPEVSLITNIGYDHMDMLGDTLPEIAREKAGIIKSFVPVVISEYIPEVNSVFESVAKASNAPLYHTDEVIEFSETDLNGSYQSKNIKGVIKVIQVLRDLAWAIEDNAVTKGLQNVVSLTGLKGRWQKLNDSPLTICDTGHNKEAFQYIIDQIASLGISKAHMVLGFVNDKNVEALLRMIPESIALTFCQSGVPRAMPLEVLKEKAQSIGIKANYIKDVNQAIAAVSAQAAKDDLIFVGGSTFVAAEIDNL